MSCDRDRFLPFANSWFNSLNCDRCSITVPGAGKAELVFTGEDGTEIRETIHDFDGPGVIQGMHNIDESIASFARSCFTYALDTKQDLWFATKDTISKKYDQCVEIFNSCLIKFLFVLCIKDFLENIFECVIVFLRDCVFCCKPQILFCI